ncbi:hypothetical protein [Thermoleptolyngbya sp. C42_A2020_037]|uniref:hypothetical protein n=1 Tax=Thermoleptolyngbya sp. C42_A2020_037 TaxID=2747799 RepID=UPI0019DBD419|nr:hypothetical protein [Thermoleptolyngbya sp. C42_A2020_037]MBF2083619.1 hypothetical protein [Thermoleptolyngbya sp. C42_A2020_037]
MGDSRGDRFANRPSPAVGNGFVGLNAILSQGHANSAILDLEAGTDYHTFYQAVCSARRLAKLGHP